MKANELRLGNFIYWDIPEKENVIHKVVGIGNGKPTTTPISLGEIIEDYEPIPLTEEWLVRLGFDEWSDGHWKTRNSLNKNGWSDKFNYYLPYNTMSTYCGNVIIEYVHQMQNLYFALAGDELQDSATP